MTGAPGVFVRKRSYVAVSIKTALPKWVNNYAVTGFPKLCALRATPSPLDLIELRALDVRRANDI